jgi:hypothetical protein
MNKLFFLPTLICLVLIVSCKKTQVDNETTSSTDFALVCEEFFQILPNVNEKAVVKQGLFKLSNPHNLPLSVGLSDSLSGDTAHDALGVFTNTANLPVLWLKYNNNLGNDGKTRNGAIKISFTKKYNVIGTVATITFVNYSVAGISCQGTLTITRNTYNSFAYTVTDGLLAANNWSSKFAGNMALTLFDNSTPNDASDDYVQALGNGNGTNRDNKKYEFTITESLKKNANCAWISQGLTNITPSGLHTRSLNFGNGTCDDVAAFTIDSQTFTVHMSK